MIPIGYVTQYLVIPKYMPILCKLCITMHTSNNEQGFS